MKKYHHLLFSLCLLTALFIVHPAHASGSCTGDNAVSESVNDSIHYACAQDDVRGTMWISDNNSTSSVSSKVRVDDWESGDGKVTVYLHGAIIGDENGAYGDHIKLIKGDDTISGIADDYDAYSPLEDMPSCSNDTTTTANCMWRTGNARGDNNISSSVQAIKLNVKKMVEVEGDNHDTDGFYFTYKIPIQAFRCYGWGENTPSDDNGACYSSKSTLVVEVNMERTLTAYARDLSNKDNDGEYLYLNGGSPIDQDSVAYGGTANVTSSGTEFTGYSWVKWGGNGVCSGAGTNRNCSVSNMEKNHNVNAYYEKNIYQGNSQATGGSTSWSDSSTAKTGWKSSGTSSNMVTYYVNGCDPVNGCSAKIRHLLKQKSGSASTQYKISRISNYGTVTSNDNLVSITTEAFNESDISTDDGGRKYRAVYAESFTNTLYPGQVVCETLQFAPDNMNGTSVGDASTTACVAALGNAQPDDTAAHTFIDINVNSSKYPVFQKEIYAKPNDEVTYQATYEPILQYTAALIPQKMKINSGSIYPTGTTFNTISTLPQLFNSRYTGQNWNNAFSVYSANFQSNITLNYCNKTTCDNSNKPIYNVGNTDKKTETNQHTVLANSEVGVSLDETAETNFTDVTKTTPSQVSFTHPSGTSYNLATVSTASEKSDPAHVYVPYNFSNSTEIITDEDATLYAGETKQIKYKYIISPKSNSVTMKSGDRDYATKVGAPKWRLEICIGETDCNNGNYISTGDKTPSTTTEIEEFNISDMYAGKTGDNAIVKSTTINVPDYPAGTRVCVRSAVYPKTSGAETNWNDPEGDHQWAYPAAPTCFKIAKKPSIQIWGGNIYSDIDMKTFTATKRHLNGYNDYKIEGSYGKSYTFGSWGELGMISNGIASGLGSGASLGYASTPASFGNYGISGVSNGAILKPASNASPGGNTKNDYCTLSPLSFANDSCNSIPSVTGQLGSSVLTQSASEDFNEIISQFAKADEGSYSTAEGGIINNPANISGSAYYYHSESDITLPSSTVNRRTVQIIRSDKSITIGGDITYEDTYSSLEDVPKLIIYAEKDINIDCDVARVDAILLTTGKVNTCSSGPNPNVNPNDSRLASKQLIINGTVLASGLEANRTYGAATGANSIVPAEIINFDPTLYHWSSYGSEGTNGEGSTNNSVNLDVVYQIELAPRY